MVEHARAGRKGKSDGQGAFAVERGLLAGGDRSFGTKGGSVHGAGVCIGGDARRDGVAVEQGAMGAGAGSVSGEPGEAGRARDGGHGDKEGGQLADESGRGDANGAELDRPRGCAAARRAVSGRAGASTRASIGSRGVRARVR